MKMRRMIAAAAALTLTAACFTSCGDSEKKILPKLQKLKLQLRLRKREMKRTTIQVMLHLITSEIRTRSVTVSSSL